MKTTGVFHVAAGMGRSFYGPGDRYTFLVTGEQSGGSMFALDCLLGAGGGPPPHRHLAEHELFVIYDGVITFTADGETRTVGSGESVFVPRGTGHHYVNSGATDAGCWRCTRRPGWKGGLRRCACR